MSEVRIGAQLSVTGWVQKVERKGKLLTVVVPMGTRIKDKDTGEFKETFKAWHTAKAWGSKADELEATGVKKGDKVVLTGKFEPEEYNGKIQFNLSWPEVEILESAEESI